MTDRRKTSRTQTRWLIVALLVVVAFFGSYAFAQARGTSSGPVAQPALLTTTVGASAQGGGAGGAACACCGGASAPAGAATTGKAKVSGGVQTIAVDLSKGYYDPSTIELKAGVPAEITFGQSSGCTGQVQSADLGFAEDLTAGPKTVKLPALKAGTYSFACGMNMVFGSIVVK
jgi:hypothetical protein